MELNATAKVILGMLAARPRSGYEIKQLVDKSTRFFWAASYGRIYPELKRLAKEGLIQGTDSSQGARPRTVYKLTVKGKRAAREWIDAPSEVSELRDEALLKLFFAGTLNPARSGGIARERAAESAAVATQLRAIEDFMHAGQKEEHPPYSTDEGSDLVLRFGIALNEWTAEWFERAAGELEEPKQTAKTNGRNR